jgi:hypothetical protein
VTVQLDVASPEHYDALLGASGLNAAGEAEQPAVAVIATGTIGGRTAVAQDAAKERKVTFVAIVCATAASLAFVGLILVRRGTRRPDPIEPDGPSPSSGGVPPEDAAVSSGAPAAPAPPAADAPARRPPRGKICPTCGERYPNEATFCGKDATMLVLLN